MDARIPVTLLTGFLGSGKTTLLNRLLQDPSMAGAAVLVNEAGETGIDHHLVEQSNEDVVLLPSGCLCCSVRGDLSRSLRDLFMRRLRREIGALDRVVIETTGLADPAPVIHTLLYDFFLAERFALTGVVCTVDAQHFAQQVDTRPEVLRQVALADRLVLTKTDLVPPEQAASVRHSLAALNPSAPCLSSQEAVATLIEGLSAYCAAGQPEQASGWLNEAAIAAEAERVRRLGVLGAYGAQAPAAVHDASVVTHVLRFAAAVDWAAFCLAFDTLQAVAGERLLRVKGLVNVSGQPQPRVIHAVGHERYPTQTLAHWPDEDRETRLVFIVAGLPKAVIERPFRDFIEAG